jgi:hypothetical protein
MGPTYDLDDPRHAAVQMDRERQTKRLVAVATLIAILMGSFAVVYLTYTDVPSGAPDATGMP